MSSGSEAWWQEADCLPEAGVNLLHLAVHGYSEGQAQDLHPYCAQTKDVRGQQALLEPHLHCCLTRHLLPGARCVQPTAVTELGQVHGLADLEQSV